MSKTIAVLLLASVIVAGGCRGGGENRVEQPVTPSPDVALEEFRRLELERQVEELRRVRAERRAARQQQIDATSEKLGDVEQDVARLQAELERLAGKGLDWVDEAEQELEGLKELNELLQEQPPDEK